jgi:iron(III) transport system substrate-binding protein
MLKSLFIFIFLLCNSLISVAKADLIVLAEGFDTYTNLINDFESATGETVWLLNANFKDNMDRITQYNLPENLSQKGAVKPDLLITKDLVYLAQVKKAGYTKPFDQLPIFQKIKPGMMDSKDNHWVGISYRARTLAYGPNVDVSELNTYEDLSKTEWAGRICLRTSNSSYNLGMVSYLISEYGETKAKDILLGWVDNLAQPEFKSDGDILKALNSGECEVGIVNHYYLAREYEKAQADGTSFNVKIKYLNQGQGGVHTNGYGVALLNTSENKDTAQKFVEMLLSEKAQLQISSTQLAFPVIQGLTAQTLIQGWGDFETSPLVWSEIGENTDLAQKLMLETNYK